MALKLYLVPVVRRAHPIYRIPAYFWHAPSGYVGLPELQNVRQAGQWTHKLEEVYVLAADLDVTQEAALMAQPDVMGVPDLDNTIPNTTVRDVVRSFLETINIPGQWVVVGMSYRTILRVVLGLWRFRAILQHFGGSRIFYDTLDLDKTVSQMSAFMQTALASTADALDLDYSAVTGATTIRQLLYGAGQQFAATPVIIYGGAGVQFIAANPGKAFFDLMIFPHIWNALVATLESLQLDYSWTDVTTTCQEFLEWAGQAFADTFHVDPIIV